MPKSTILKIQNRTNLYGFGVQWKCNTNQAASHSTIRRCGEDARNEAIPCSHMNPNTLPPARRLSAPNAIPGINTQLGCHRRLDAKSSKYRMAYYIFDSLRHATCPREAFERLCRRAVCGLGSGESRGAQLGDIRLRAEWAQAGGGSPAPLGKDKHVRRKR